MFALSPFRIASFLAMAAVLILIGWSSLRSEEARDRGLLTGAVGDSSGAGPGGVGQEHGGRSGPTGGLDLTAGARRIVVDVSGAVRRPGVYRFEHGQRVIDAIKRAGGATGAASAAGINRAAVLADGQQVVVPSRAASGVASGAGPGVGTGLPGEAEGDAPISLGTATQQQLEQIEGIGPVTAQSILEFRDSQGGISTIDELDQVSGIGPVTMEALRSRLQP